LKKPPTLEINRSQERLKVEKIKNRTQDHLKSVFEKLEFKWNVIYKNLLSLDEFDSGIIGISIFKDITNS
jgi:hypothetical protein